MLRFVVLASAIIWGGAIFFLFHELPPLLQMAASFVSAVGIGYLAHTIFAVWYAFTEKEDKVTVAMYSGLLTDLVNPFLTAVLLFCIYFFARPQYAPSSLDLASFALGFYNGGIQQLWSIRKDRIGGARLRVEGLLLFFVLLVGFLVGSIWLFKIIYEGEFYILQSIWLQVTVLVLAFYFYVESRRINCIFRNGGYLEVSNASIAFFRRIGHEPRMLFELRQRADRVNSNTRRAKSKNSARIRQRARNKK